MKRLETALLLVISTVALTGCDPGIGVAWQKQFDHPISPSCIEAALKSVSTSVHRRSYVSDGGRGFPKGIKVTQFGYSDPSGAGYYNLDVAPLPGGKTNYWHGWSKIGTNIPADQLSRILPLLNKANRAVSASCGLSFDDVIPKQGED